MNTTPLRRAIVPGLAAIALATSLAACGSDDSAASGDAAMGGTASGLSGKVAAGGSSAQEQAQESWRAGFGQANPDVTISYDAVGSGDGRANFISGAYAFAGSDSAMDDSEIKQATKKCGAAPVEFPVFISPIDVVYNLKGVDKLNLDAKTTAEIFSGKITKWNDPAIAKLNPGTKLPSTAITTVHRSDSSGTTNNFTDYLNQAGGGAWSDAPSDDWPTTKGETGEGTSGVVGAVQGGDGTIGYADDSGVQGTNLGIANIKVGSKYVAPSAEGAANAMSTSKLVSGRPASIMEYKLDRMTTDPKSYPIFMASYALACQKSSDADTGKVVKGFLQYMISPQGQKAAAANAKSAAVPAPIAKKEAAIVAKMS